MARLPLEGIRIIDSTYVFALPYAGGLLADMGAEVIKVEGPGRPVGYAVKMVQLPRERSMNRLLRQGEVSRKDIRRLADKIASFHGRAETGPEISRLGSLEVVRANILEDREVRR